MMTLIMFGKLVSPRTAFMVFMAYRIAFFSLAGKTVVTQVDSLR
jgi:hypothetical protein